MTTDEEFENHWLELAGALQHQNSSSQQPKGVVIIDLGSAASSACDALSVLDTGKEIA